MSRATYTYTVWERYERNLYDEVGVYHAPNARKACRLAAQDCGLNTEDLVVRRHP